MFVELACSEYVEFPLVHIKRVDGLLIFVGEQAEHVHICRTLTVVVEGVFIGRLLQSG